MSFKCCIDLEKITTNYPGENAKLTVSHIWINISTYAYSKELCHMYVYLIKGQKYASRNCNPPSL